MLTYGFYNSFSESVLDRKYDAKQMAQIFDGVILDGVYMTIGDKLMVKPGVGMQITVGTGRAWFNHTWTLNDAAYPIAVAASEALLNRIDIVVLETNHGISSRMNTLRVIKGVPNASPVPPALVNTDMIKQYALAHIRVNAGITAITASMITNKVGTSGTPFVTGVLQGMDIDELLTQWGARWEEITGNLMNASAEMLILNQASFDKWFEDVQTQLGEDVAGNLLNLINAGQRYPLTTPNGDAYKDTTKAKDLNDMIDAGEYLIYTENPNNPSQNTAFLSIKTSDRYVYQEVRELFTGLIYTRKSLNDGSSWSGWDPLLTVARNQAYQLSKEDGTLKTTWTNPNCNALTANYPINCTGNQTYNNHPVNNARALILPYRIDKDNGYQLYITEGGIYFRYQSNSVYKEWHRVKDGRDMGDVLLWSGSFTGGAASLLLKENMSNFNTIKVDITYLSGSHLAGNLSEASTTQEAECTSFITTPSGTMLLSCTIGKVDDTHARAFNCNSQWLGSNTAIDIAAITVTAIYGTNRRSF